MIIIYPHLTSHYIKFHIILWATFKKYALILCCWHLFLNLIYCGSSLGTVLGLAWVAEIAYFVSKRIKFTFYFTIFIIVQHMLSWLKVRFQYWNTIMLISFFCEINAFIWRVWASLINSILVAFIWSRASTGFFVVAGNH